MKFPQKKFEDPKPKKKKEKKKIKRGPRLSHSELWKGIIKRERTTDEESLYWNWELYKSMQIAKYTDVIYLFKQTMNLKFMVKSSVCAILFRYLRNRLL